tara:strand:- start:49 stop:1497 length:1449 start_codon:yes stop_codon:yes gene_type:complete
MKLLGLRICDHDSNISYYDGNKVHYLKTERKFKDKQHGIKDLNLWKNIIYEQWGILEKDLDEIAIVFDPWQYGLHTRDDGFFPAIELKDFSTCRVTRVNHHYAHHLSCWPLIKDPHKLNGFSIDGWGDFDQVWTVFKNKKIQEKGSLACIGSIGNEYCQAGHWFDLKVNKIYDMPGKVMGLQSFGNLDQEFLDFLKKFDFYNIKNIFDVNYYSDKPDKKLDWLRTIHLYISNLLIDFLSKHFSKDEVFCYTGGVALNVCWNTEIRKIFKNVIIPPHTGDEGLSLGALEYLRIKHNLSHFKIDNFPYCQSDSSPNNHPSNKLIDKVSNLLKKQKIVGWYQGHGEIGPRALGNRSILADPRDYEMKKRVNDIKQREYFRPFGCSTIDDNFSKSDYMLYTNYIDKNKYPSITHVDNTCRHNTINNNFIFESLLKQFFQITQCKTLLNTSLNINGKPLASDFDDAFVLFRSSSLDVLVYGDELYEK